MVRSPANALGRRAHARANWVRWMDRAMLIAMIMSGSEIHNRIGERRHEQG